MITCKELRESHFNTTGSFLRSLVILTAARMASNSAVKIEAAEERLPTAAFLLLNAAKPTPFFQISIHLYILITSNFWYFGTTLCFGSLPLPYSDQIQLGKMVQWRNWRIPAAIILEERFRLRSSTRFLILLPRNRLSSRELKTCLEVDPRILCSLV